MNDPTPLLSRKLDRLASRYFGDEWAAPASRFSGVNRRTLQRIRQASRENREDDASAGALAAFRRAADAFHAAVVALCLQTGSDDV